MKTFKRTLVILILLLGLKVHGQDELKNLKTFIYNSYDDFKNEKGQYIGEYETFTWTKLVGLKLKTKKGSPDNKTSYRIKSKMWGFKIGDIVFRTFKYKSSRPLQILNTKEKIFYTDKYFISKNLRNIYTTGLVEYPKLFYSDNYVSKVHLLKKLEEKEKDNSSLTPIIDCLYGKPRFQKVVNCIKKF